MEHLFDFISGFLLATITSSVNNVNHHNNNIKDRILLSEYDNNVFSVLDNISNADISINDIDSLKSFYHDINKPSIHFQTIRPFFPYQNIRNRLLRILTHELRFFIYDLENDVIGNEEYIGTREEIASNLTQVIHDIINFDCNRYVWYRCRINKFYGNSIHIEMKKAFNLH